MLLNPAYQDPEGKVPSELLDFIRVAGAIALDEPMPEKEADLAEYFTAAVNALANLLEGAELADEGKNPPVLFQASCNRKASPSIWRSRLAVKADAAVLLFSIRCNGLTWAVVDSGVDARHPAFRRLEKQPDDVDDSEWSRVRRSSTSLEFANCSAASSMRWRRIRYSRRFRRKIGSRFGLT